MCVQHGTWARAIASRVSVSGSGDLFTTRRIRPIIHLIYTYSAVLAVALSQSHADILSKQLIFGTKYTSVNFTFCYKTFGYRNLITKSEPFQLYRTTLC